MGTNIAWLTPLGPHSDIGAHSLCIADAMHKVAPDYDCSLSIFVEQNGSTYRSKAPRYFLNESFDPDLLDLFDVQVLNIGNNRENHLSINRLAIQKGGIVVVHDMVMQHYLAWTVFEGVRQPAHYVDLMSQYYGVKALDVLDTSRITLNDRPTRYAPWDTPHAFSFPLIEPFLDKARAIIVHSQFAADLVAQLTDRPQLKLFLPSDKKPAPARKPTTEGRVLFSSLGHIGSSKHIHYCIEAFRDSSILRTHAMFAIVGGASDKEYIAYLLQLVRESALDEWIRFDLDVTEDRLFEVKGETDVFINVRYPNTESASGSLAEQMACGAPVIVYDSGCYREVFDDTVLKIHELSSSDALRNAMERLALDRTLRDRLGQNALSYGEQRTAENYARKFLDFVTEPDFRRRTQISRSFSAYPSLNWLKPCIGNLLPDPPQVPWFARPGNSPRFASLTRLDARNLMRHLSLSVLQASLPKLGLRRGAMMLIGQPRHKISLAFGRIAFFREVCKSMTPIQPAELDFENDPLALSILASVRPEMFIDVCYRAVLGRLPFEGEIARYIERVLSDNPGDILREFADSEECRQRSLPRDLTAGFRRLAFKVSSFQPDRAAHNMVLSIDEPTSIGELYSRGVLTEGWHELEVEGVWSSARKSVAAFAVNLKDELPFSVRMEARVAGFEWAGPQTLTININGDDVVRYRILNGERFAINVPVGDIDLSDIVMSMILGNTIRLADHIPNGDNRDLGIFLYGIEVVRSQSDG